MQKLHEIRTLLYVFLTHNYYSRINCHFIISNSVPDTFRIRAQHFNITTYWISPPATYFDPLFSCSFSRHFCMHNKVYLASSVCPLWVTQIYRWQIPYHFGVAVMLGIHSSSWFCLFVFYFYISLENVMKKSPFLLLLGTGKSMRLISLLQQGWPSLTCYMRGSHIFPMM